SPLISAVTSASNSNATPNLLRFRGLRPRAPSLPGSLALTPSGGRRDLEAHVGAAQGRLALGVVSRTQLGFSAVPRLAGATHVDLAGQFGDVRENDHAVVTDLDEAAVHRGPLLGLALPAHDPDDTDLDNAEKR